MFVSLAFGSILAMPLLAQAASGTAGSLTFDVGFAEVPALLDEPNAVVVAVRDAANGSAVTQSRTFSLSAELVHEATVAERDVVVGPAAGAYGIPVVPTATGDWAVRLSGMYQGNPFSIRISCNDDDATFPCPVERAELGFPVEAAESAKLASRFGELEVGVANVTASDPMGFFGVIAGILGLLAGGAALLKMRVE